MSTSIFTEVRGAKLQIIPRRWGSSIRASEHYAAPRMYVTVSDETVFENIANRKRRPYNIYKTLIHSSGISDVLDVTSLRWSQKAGCTLCPCSPGFILNSQTLLINDETVRYFDVWVTLESAPSVDERKAPRVPVLV